MTAQELLNRLLLLQKEGYDLDSISVNAVAQLSLSPAPILDFEFQNGIVILWGDE